MYMDNSYPFKKPEVSRIKINETYRMEKKKQKPESDTVQSKPDT